MRSKTLIVLLALLLFSSISSESSAAGKYMLAFWREMSCTEVGGCNSGGSLIMRVWVFDEYGTPLPNVRIVSSGGNWWYTQPNGDRVDIVMNISGATSYRLVCSDTNGSSSDITPLMTTNRWPNWGHNSYEMAFVYKSDASTVPIYDTSIIGTVNSTINYDTDAPCTGSMAYYGIDPLDWYSGNWILPDGGWGEHGQTFVATGNRLAQVEFHGAVPNNGQIDWSVEIREGGPTGNVVGSKLCQQHWSQDPWCISFKLTGYGACVLVPGQTYFARFYRTGGMNAYYSTRDNYKQGQAYWRANSTDPWVAAPGPDIRGHFTCANVGTNYGKITGRVTANYLGIDDAIVTLSPGQSGEKSVYTASGGSFDLPPVPAGTYTVSVWKPGYSRVTQTVQVTSNQMPYFTFAILPLTNSVNNPSFESAETGWTKYGDSMTVANSGTFQVYGYEGSKFIGYIASGIGSKNAGAWQRITNLSPAAEYAFSVYTYTQSYNGDPTYPSLANCQTRMGIDLTGGTDPSSSNIQWTSWQDHQGRWLPTWVRAVATGTSATIFIEGLLKQPNQWNKVAFDGVYVTTDNVRITAGPTVSNVTPVSAIITWNTDVASTSKVEYGPTSSYGSSLSDGALTTSHRIVLTGLAPGTLYHYRVVSSAGEYQDAVSFDQSFTLPQDNGNIAGLKSLADGASVGLVRKIAVCGNNQMLNRFYIEDSDRSSGIMVNTTVAVKEGDEVSVAGTLSTVNGERVINASGVYTTP